MRATMFSYDIPETAGYVDRLGKFHALPNPSGVLRRIGERINLSVWILPDTSIVEARALADWLQRHGANTKWCRFDEDEPGAIQQIAREGAREDCERIRGTLDERIGGCRSALDAAEHEHACGNIDRETFDRTQADILYQTDRAILDARRAIEDAEVAAALFDVSGDVRDMIDALRQTIRADETAADAGRAAAGIAPPRTRKATRIGTVGELIAHHEKQKDKDPDAAPAARKAAPAQQTTIGACYAPTTPTAPQAAPQGLPDDDDPLAALADLDRAA